MSNMDDSEIRHLLNELYLEHKDLEDTLQLMSERPFVDELQIKRIKKRKLRIKDEIKRLESKLIPDIEA